MVVKFILPFVCILSLFCRSSFSQEFTADPVLNVSQLISAQGYSVENHNVETSDGFILSIQRIPLGRNQVKSEAPRPVVFLQHGLLDSAATWVINFPRQSLGFILADAGFDVFLGNVRGNTYSSRNTKYKSNTREFWNLVDFDFMASIDLPTMINYVLKVTGQQSLVYIGHSQGTIMGFAGFPFQPELAAKVDIFIALAPVAWVAHQKSLVLEFMAKLNLIEIFEIFGDKSFLPNNIILDEIGGHLCKSEPFMCADVIFLLCGWDKENLNYTRLPVYMTHTPAGTSVRNIAHWSQQVKTGKFQMYDYGSAQNKIHYNGSTTPPLYKPEQLKSPKMALFYGDKDDLADPTDVRKLISVFPDSNKPVHIDEQKLYSHLDYTWGMDAFQKIYPNVVQLAKQHSRTLNH